MAFDPADYHNRIILTSGDFRSEMTSRGWPVGESIAWAAAKRPDLVGDTVAAFLDAGADIVITPTADANDLTIDEAGTSEMDADRVVRINRRAAQLCRAAVEAHPSRKRLVIGALGPPRGLVSLGEIDRERLVESYGRQAEALAAGGTDAIVCQSFSEAESLAAAVEAAASASGLPVIGEMTFDCGPERTETSMGVTVPQACTAVAGAGGTVIGCNAGESPDDLAIAIGLARQSCDLPIWAVVGAGLPELEEGRLVYTESPKAYGERLAPLADAGACFIGGGAGVAPEHIAALAAARTRRIETAKRPRATGG